MALLGPRGYLWHKATSSRLGDITDLLNRTNTWKQKGKVRQRSMFQRKEQDKILEKEIKKMEVNNLPEKELMVIKMLTKVGRRMDEQ